MKPSAITTADVQHLAELARIRLTDAEITRFQKELASLLGYMRQIQEADTKNTAVKPTVAARNVMRADSIQSSLDQSAAVSNRNDTSENGYFSIKAVLGALPEEP